ncbi:MAG: N5-glutamine methyltransferase family protein, partial [Acidimicrobiia bacterium]
ETEFVTGVAIDAVRGQALSGEFPLVDLGTGSGAIALALAREVPQARVCAVERSLAALEVAAANAVATLPPSRRPELFAGSWFDPLPSRLAGRLRLVVSNPPYVSEEEWPQLPAVVRDYEPREALVSGPTGLEAIACVVLGGVDWLAPAGILVCELAPSQAEAATGLARRAGYERVSIRRDWSGRERVLVAGRPT